MIDYLDTHQWLRHGLESAPGPDTLETPARELRAAPRTAVIGDAVLIPLDAGHRDLEPLQVTLRDVSSFGIGLVSDRALEPDSRWRIEFLTDARRVGEHLVAVRHCEREDSGYHAGAQFCAAPDLLDKLGAGGIHAAAA